MKSYLGMCTGRTGVRNLHPSNECQWMVPWKHVRKLLAKISLGRMVLLQILSRRECIGSMRNSDAWKLQTLTGGTEKCLLTQVTVSFLLCSRSDCNKWIDIKHGHTIEYKLNMIYKIQRRYLVKKSLSMVKFSLYFLTLCDKARVIWGETKC